MNAPAKEIPASERLYREGIQDWEAERYFLAASNLTLAYQNLSLDIHKARVRSRLVVHQIIHDLQLKKPVADIRAKLDELLKTLE